MNTPRNPNNNPAINPDDPKWTAYVLGEVTEADRLEIEHLLETSEEARALVEDLTLATTTLKEELFPNTTLMMSAEQRAVIRTAAEPKPRRWFEMFPSNWGLGVAAAALIVMAVVLPVVWQGSESDPFAGAPSTANLDAPEQAKAVAEPAASPEARTAPADVASNDVFDQAERKAPQTLQRESLATVGAVKGVQNEQRAEQTLSVPLSSTSDSDLKKENSGRADVVDLVRSMEERGANVTFNGLRADGFSNGNAPVATPPPPPPGGPPSAATVLPAELAKTGPGIGSGVSAGTLGGGRGGGGGGGRGAIRSAENTFARDGVSVQDQRLQQGQGGQGQQGQGQQAGQQGQGQQGQQGQQGRLAAAPPPPPPAAAAAPPARIDRPVVPNPNTEAYDRITDNPFIRTTQENLATFSIDVDTASYANVRRFLNQNQLPPRDAVRIEELVNYFSYDYARPSGNDPIAPNMEVAAAPWNPSNRLVRIGVKAREVNANRRPPSNLVFLIDVSGSMSSPERLPLVKAGLGMLVERLGENDIVSMVVYAGNSGLALPPTSGVRKEVIRQAIDRLEAGGSTNGASGIQLAYNQASANMMRNGVNRVILMTDGDFNVGVTNQSDLVRLIQDRAKTGVFLSVLGFGMGNIKDSTLEKLADEGNGHYAYIDNLAEARKVLVEEMSGTLVTVAKDVKIQVDFNPAKVEAYRLIGYENRILRTEDFNNDAKDAGDMGAGHTVTALFEVVPKGGEVPGPSVDPSKYTQAAAAAAPAGNVGSNSNEMLTLRVRYKEPNADTSKRMDIPLVDRGAAFARATTDFRFAAAVAQFGMILRDSPFRGNSRMEFVLDTAQTSRGEDRNGYRSEFITLVQKARNLGR